jgi:N,N'-diacetyllegionaminate synthase
MSKTCIIAEAGVNHNGNLDLAKQLIEVAALAGADYVKFQTFKADKIAIKRAPKAEYQKYADKEESQLDMLKKLELNEAAHHELIEYCKKKNIQFLSTPFDLVSIDLLKQLGIKLGKIPSGEITNLPYLRKMANVFEKLVISTGMAYMEEIAAALEVITNEGFQKSNIILLQCNTEYPTPLEDVNLRAMKNISDTFQVRVGYSDHTDGIEVPIAAVALGACVIEKHFTLDKRMEGPDHKVSLEPAELKQMIDSIRKIEQALGSTQKVPSLSEMKNISIARKSIVAARKISQGEKFTEENLTTKRPGNGISPMRWNELLNLKASRDFEEDDLIVL